jgi:hypothetical protein
LLTLSGLKSFLEWGPGAKPQEKSNGFGPLLVWEAKKKPEPIFSSQGAAAPGPRFKKMRTIY